MKLVTGHIQPGIVARWSNCLRNFYKKWQVWLKSCLQIINRFFFTKIRNKRQMRVTSILLDICPITFIYLRFTILFDWYKPQCFGWKEKIDWNQNKCGLWSNTNTELLKRLYMVNPFTSVVRLTVFTRNTTKNGKTTAKFTCKYLFRNVILGTHIYIKSHQILL